MKSYYEAVADAPFEWDFNSKRRIHYHALLNTLSNWKWKIRESLQVWHSWITDPCPGWDTMALGFSRSSQMRTFLMVPSRFATSIREVPESVQNNLSCVQSTAIPPVNTDKILDAIACMSKVTNKTEIRRNWLQSYSSLFSCFSVEYITSTVGLNLEIFWNNSWEEK